MKCEIIPWSVCGRKFIRRVRRDNDEILSIVDGIRLRKKRADESFRKKEYLSLVMEDYYEVIKELLVACLLKNGFRSRNHQCMISFFLMKNPKYDVEANLISRMLFYRNKSNYYGKKVPEKFVLDNYDNFNKVVKCILELINRGE